MCHGTATVPLLTMKGQRSKEKNNTGDTTKHILQMKHINVGKSLRYIAPIKKKN